MEEREREGELPEPLLVNVPNVLIDPNAPVHSRPLDDHIEVKLLLLLPVDHPLQLAFTSDGNRDAPQSAEADLKSLLSLKEGVQFYCKRCEGMLTRAPIRCFIEIPSVNWRELVDNWFGGCCCSFGGACEKLVDKYVDAYNCTEGVCYLSSFAVTLCKNDLVLGSQFSDKDRYRKDGAGSCHCESLAMDELQERMRLLVCSEDERRKDGVEESEDSSEHMALKIGCCGSICHSGADFEEVDGHTIQLVESEKDRALIQDFGLRFGN